MWELQPLRSTMRVRFDLSASTHVCLDCPLDGTSLLSDVRFSTPDSELTGNARSFSDESRVSGTDLNPTCLSVPLRT